MPKKVIFCKTKCSTCGNIFEFWRKASKLKKVGHEKHVFCYKCNKVTLHEELDSNL